jgi:sulfonate transport system ATP-binding protein
MTALGAERLTKSFGERPVLGPVTLTLTPGTLTAVIGPSGSGKSTLLRCLAGLEEPSGGRIALGAGTVPGYVFQEPRLMPWLSVRRNAGFGLPRGRAAEAAVDEALRVVGLTEAADLLPKQLSGGMAQRAGLARALAARPSLLLLDEPFSALDPLKRAAMQAHLQAIRRHYDPTMVLITHDMDEALVLADRVLVMHGPPGRIVADIPVALPDGRDRTAPPFQAYRRRLMEWLSEGAVAA